MSRRSTDFTLLFYHIRAPNTRDSLKNLTKVAQEGQIQIDICPEK